eukprot:TRINITY_DN1765_c0_g1_i1.p1 TRINITY_DN1765_c0_g1~~TRINITY_DN1765_c0_g1_i1.p1  ORF type:complete len:1070 (+),score=303.07 TRINITY_DN1765_c0_g1_i1:145-3354(+)
MSSSSSGWLFICTLSILMMDEVRVNLPLPDEEEDIASERRSLEVPRIYTEIKQKEQIMINEEHREKKIEQQQEKKVGKVKGKKPSKDAKESPIDQSKKHIIVEHQFTLEQICDQFLTSIDDDDPIKSFGITNEEAATRLLEDGPNALTSRKRVPMWLKFLKQFVGFFPLLLEGAGILCFIGYALQPSDPNNLYLGIILWIVVIITAIFSFLQEAKSSNVMDSFKNMAPSFCIVNRGGKTCQIDASQLVRGDIVQIKAGDKTPADLFLLRVDQVKVDNSSLTGEAEPQSRSTVCTDENPLETRNLLFSSTLILEGTAVGVVIRTGDTTVIGNIAALASATSLDATVLRKEIARFIKIVSVVAISLGLIFFAVGFIVSLHWVTNVVFVIGIVVANVPEGLLPTVTVALTLTAKRLAKKNVLVKNLDAVETLGSCTVIASDKTGTLTQNRMTVEHCVCDETVHSCRGDAVPPSNDSFTALQRIATLCNRAVFDQAQDNLDKNIDDRKTVGDASESALLKFCEKITSVAAYRLQYPKVFEIPFNSVNKWQLSVHVQPDGRLILLMKGAPERIIAKCTQIMIQGAPVAMAKQHLDKFEHNYQLLAGNGERVLGFAQLELDPELYTPSHTFDQEDSVPTEGLTFVGLVSLIDPPRPSVPHAVQVCKEAGLRVIMVTGDHPLTAAAIARQVGIIEGETAEDIAKREQIHISQVDRSQAAAVVIKGSDLEDYSEEDWDRALSKKEIVFARTSPEQKLQIVTNLQRKGEIVAVTGDGVNDSPALKKSDLGCAMGITGSDVAKDAADVILLDDNFASIVSGIEEGRIIFDNLKKSITYTLSSNSAELIPFVLFVVAGIPLALSAVLILCIDLGTDMIPAISLAYERAESDIMKRPPRDARKDRLVTLKLALFSYLYLGTWQALGGFIAYLTTLNSYGFNWTEITGISLEYFRKDSPDFKGKTAQEQLDILAEAQTAFFVAVVIIRIGCILVCKTRKLSIFSMRQLSNKILNIGVGCVVVLTVLLSYTPGITTVFGTKSIGWQPWIIGFPFCVALIATEELRKFAIRRNPHGLVKRLTYW